MLNAGMVNARTPNFRRRVFANLFAFWADFCDSKIRLNIFADRELTSRQQFAIAFCSVKSIG
jgi:hypothetical protein